MPRATLIASFMRVLNNHPTETISRIQLISEHAPSVLEGSRIARRDHLVDSVHLGKNRTGYRLTPKGTAYLAALKGDWTEIDLLRPK